MTLALLFPGQGSQYIGMAGALADKQSAAAEVLARADETLGFSLSGLMRDGPEDALTATKNAQPALLVESGNPTQFHLDMQEKHIPMRPNESLSYSDLAILKSF